MEYDMPASLIDPRVKLRHISCFLEVNRQGGVVPAGEVLGLSQPAVSKAIAELEEILGTALFDRSRRKLVLTDAGAIFMRHATAAVSALRQGLDRVGQGRGGQAAVRLGALPTVQAEIVPQAISLFGRTGFAARVTVDSGPSPYLLSRLRGGAIDFVVGRMPQPEVMAGLVFEHLYSEGLVVVVRPGHPLELAPPASLRAIEPYPVILPPEGAIIRPTVDTLLLAASVGRLAQEVESVSNSFGRAYTLATDAIWIISRSVVASDLKLGHLKALPFDMSASHGPVGIVTRAGDDLPVAGLAFIDGLRAVVAERLSLQT
jgi:LysR family transcriptional regulator, pca operon transcriptional activator